MTAPDFKIQEIIEDLGKNVIHVSIVNMVEKSTTLQDIIKIKEILLADEYYYTNSGEYDTEEISIAIKKITKIKHDNKN